MYISLPIALLILISCQLYSDHVQAADGKLEINQTCVAEGCFPGDDPGFPVQITSTGSYILTGNLFIAGATAIQVSAVHVTLDLGGFEIAGDDSGAGDGIRLDDNMVGVTIRDGTLRDHGGGGVVCSNDCHWLTISGLRSVSNGGTGIQAGGANQAVVRGSAVEGNGGDGMNLSGNGVSVADCKSVDNGRFGIRVGSDSIVRNNIANDNTSDGIRVGQKVLVTGNVLRLNGEHGINLDLDALVKNNIAHNNNQSAGAFQDIETCASCTLVDNETP